MVSLLVLAGWWGVKSWRADHEAVSLDVRNMPLGELLRKIERQTGVSIVAREELLPRAITLRVESERLETVLDRIAEQAGARWARIHALHRSEAALRSLEGGLRKAGDLERIGWTTLAPADLRPDAAEPMANPIVRNTASGRNDGPVRVLRRNGTVTATVNGEVVDRWAPERVLAEIAIARSSNPPDGMEATEMEARRAARMLNARMAAYIVLEGSALGPGYALPADLTSKSPGIPKPNGRFARLTPEQRVQRSQQRRNGLIVEDRETVERTGNVKP